MTLSASEATELLESLGANARLLRHVALVGEAAEGVLAALARERVGIDETFVRAGVVLHDAGKTIHVEELSAHGARHEPAGEQLLLERGVDASLARVCRSHAAWSTLAETLEELVIALSDKLWKGVRVPALEERVIDEAAARAGRDRWEVFVPLDGAFEEIASAGDARLARS